MSALVPSASCTRIWLPPGVCMALSKAILITSPLSMTAGEPALVVTRASNDRGGATGVGGLLMTARCPYPNAVAPVAGVQRPNSLAVRTNCEIAGEIDRRVTSAAYH